MENLILTPLQLWEGYDPNGKLNIAFQKFEEISDCFYFEAYFDGDSFNCIATRIFVKGYIPKQSCEKALIIANDYNSQLSDQQLLNYSQLGYCTISFDYCGFNKELQNYTKYPKEIQYANLVFAGDYLNKAVKSAKETCIYQWTKVCRKTICFAKQICSQDCSIVVMGIKNGCDLTWQTAAIDTNVSGLINIINAGWKEYANYPKFECDVDFKMDDERVRWLTGCSPQSYAQFIKCPTLFVGASNNQWTSLDYIENTLNLIKSTNKRQDICTGYTKNIDDNARSLIEFWLKTFGTTALLPASPIIEVFAEDYLIKVNTKFENSQDIANVSVFYCFDEMFSSIRNWKTQTIMLANPKCELPVLGNHIVFAFVRVFYKNGYSLSSLPMYLDLSSKDLKKDAQKYSHIIYERKQGISGWIVESDTCFSNTKPLLKSGTFDIMGITTEGGDLSSYFIGESAKFCEEHNILQFDAYSEQKTQYKIILTVCENNKIYEYVCTSSLKEKEWKKQSFNLQDFKSQELISLKTWINVKKITFVNCKNILFNNFIWV